MFIKVRYSNESMGPYNKIKTWILDTSDDDFKKLSQRVLAESKFNNKYTLQEYFDHEATIPQGKPRVYTSLQPSGAGNTHVTVYFNNGKSISINDYYDHFITPPFNDLVRLTQEKGKYTEHGRHERDTDYPLPSDKI